ncbi:MAG: Methionine--tRNA ligase [Syntrophorhabdaceae bacterium PtaU1.Bin034]|nr:MAG: Methionine--tRNA ligase [Syntrophorhabdaceae bacterium PtaU1.Bin034]
MSRYYLTTPIYYINDVPHIGHAYTTCAADVMARYKRICGYDVFFLTGVDEHGQKAEKAALEQGIRPQELADRMVPTYTDLWKALNITNTGFIRTTDEDHHKVVRYLFEKIQEKGDIYLGEYQDWYCIPCESYFTELQLKDGKCPDCGRDVELLREESYFFAMSKYGDRLLDYLEQHRDFVMPDIRYNEVASFVKGGLRDLSISRTTFKWGIPVPGNPKHVIYVWFDALTNYLTGIGFLNNMELFERFWPCDAHLIGKDILRFHAVYWPSFLMSAGIELPKHVFAHGWWTVEGQKMSKSLGNVVDPFEVANTYGVDEFRFFLFREVPFGLDGDFSKDAIVARINGDLANDFGNLVSRSANMIQKFLKGRIEKPEESGGSDAHLIERIKALVGEYEQEMNVFSFYKALNNVFEITGLLNKYIDTEAPWKLAKENPARLPTVLYNIWNGVRISTLLLYPFMPSKTARIWKALGINRDIEKASFEDEKHFYHAGDLSSIEKTPPLFPRIETK